VFGRLDIAVSVRGVVLTRLEELSGRVSREQCF
jgi:hypothetical protein